jgi:hypothetical protein
MPPEDKTRIYNGEDARLRRFAASKRQQGGGNQKKCSKALVALMREEENGVPGMEYCSNWLLA